MTGIRRAHIPTLRKMGLLVGEPHITYIGRRFTRGPYDFTAVGKPRIPPVATDERGPWPSTDSTS